MQDRSQLHLNEKAFEKSIVSRKISPLDVFLGRKTTLDVSDPIFEEIEEGEPSLGEPFSPLRERECI